MHHYITWLKNKSSEVYRFFAFISRRFVIDGGIYQASVLTYASLLAMVPLMFVCFYALSEVAVFKNSSKIIQNFIFENFVPATGHTVQIYVEQFVHQASSLSIGGVIFLVLTAVAMIFTIENALNGIWGIKTRRHGVKAFLLYLAGLILGPILIGLAVIATSYLASLPFLAHAIMTEDVQTWLLSWTPFILAFISFSLLYIGVPNTKVKLLYGFIGAFVAAVLLEFTKYGFTLYLKQFNTYELLYGAFSTVPIFLFWLYLVWVIVLLGAEITYALSSPYIWRSGIKLDPFTHMFIWLERFWGAKKQGKSLSLAELIEQDNQGYQLSPNKIISSLLQADLITRVKKDRYFLKRDLTNLKWGEIYQLLPWKIPTLEEVKQYKLASLDLYTKQIATIQQATAGSFEKNMAELYKQEI